MSNLERTIPCEAAPKGNSFKKKIQELILQGQIDKERVSDDRCSIVSSYYERRLESGQNYNR
ncbi:unnamed protein product [Arabis nemorensis]|uniref:Uncharacterized protein n=1 Tax=Arabis nemorensis TaxID=586526 RepID=A0A565CFC3_9BRAS|nr:unnamed protein product [Arabis nemorensis]